MGPEQSPTKFKPDKQNRTTHAMFLSKQLTSASSWAPQKEASATTQSLSTVFREACSHTWGSISFWFHFTSESSFLATLWLSLCAFISTPWTRCQEPGHAWLSYHFNTRELLEATWELAILNYCLALPHNKGFSFWIFYTDMERSWPLRNKRQRERSPQEGSIWLESSDFRNGSGSVPYFNKSRV